MCPDKYLLGKCDVGVRPLGHRSVPFDLFIVRTTIDLPSKSFHCQVDGNYDDASFLLFFNPSIQHDVDGRLGRLVNGATQNQDLG